MKTLTSKYLIVLGILTLVILGSQVLMQKTISDSKSDARIINISGRQRMLSQRITKNSLKLQYAKNEEEFNLASSELASAYKIWFESQRNLEFGTNDLLVAEMNSDPELKALFEEIRPQFDQIENATSLLTKLKYQNSNDSSQISEMVEIIANHEAEFLRLMNEITFKYDELASAKNEKLANWELQLMALTFILIFIEVFLIFKPMLVASRKKDQQLSEINTLLEDNKLFTSSQIEAANAQLRKLRRIAKGMKLKLTEKEREYSLKVTEMMGKNLELTAKMENYKGQIAVLREEFERYRIETT